MTVTVVDRGPETDALLAVLASADILAGDGLKPPDAGWPLEDTSQPFLPYVVLFQGVTVQIDGPVTDPNADTISEYQLTSIGVTRASASVLARNAKDALLNTPLAIADRTVQRVEWVAGRPAQRDDDVTPPLFYVIDIYTVNTSPA